MNIKYNQPVKKCFLLACLSIFAIALNGQNWMASGAVWHYSTSIFTFDGYVKVEKASDTIIDGHVCDVLTKTRIGYNYLSSQNETLSLGREYLRLSNDTVYNFRNNQFYVLYCFNANPGDSWTIAGNNVNCSSTDVVTVDSIGTITINSTPLRCIWTSNTTSNGWRYTGKIVEKIGCVGYMFAEPHCLTDLYEGGSLRCYNDSSNWSYQSGIVPYCDYTTNVSYHNDEPELISVFPNPSVNNITVHVPNRYDANGCKFIIYDFNGRETLIRTLSSESTTVVTFDLVVGLHYWKVVDGSEQTIISGTLIKSN